MIGTKQLVIEVVSICGYLPLAELAYLTPE
jgi:hypothetical protein